MTPELAKLNKARNRRNQKERVRAYIRSLLVECKDCGIANPLVLQFHHVDGSPENKRISQLANQGGTFKSVDAEVSKCVILCANCHILRHHAEGTGYFATGEY